MPKLSQLMIRTALLWLGIGFSVGGLVLLTKDVPLWPALWTWRLSHVYMLLLGWMVQLACGAAFWMLPRLDAAGSRGNEGLAWLCYGCLNGGVVLAALHGPLAAAAVPGAGLLALAAGVLLVAAAAAFVAHAWRRVVPFGARRG